MKRAAHIWLGLVLAVLAIGAVAGAIMPGGIGGRIGAAVIGLASAYGALRVWAKAPDARNPRP
jgi:hypothetical protein